MTRQDYSSVIAIVVGSIFGMILLINTLAPEFAISIGPAFFLALMILGIYVITKLFHLERIDKLDFEAVAIYGGVIVGVIFILWQYPQIAPNFFSVVKQTMSLVGVP